MNSAVLDLAIGMIFVYLLLSLLCSALQELVSGVFKLRTKNLKQGIDTLLACDNAGFFVEQFHSHPLIDKLAPAGRSPSYIPASHFSAVVMDLLQQHTKTDPFKNITAAVAALPEGQMKQSLRIMAARCKGEADGFVGELEQWFDHGMDRASGWYKRKSQLMMLPIALVLAIAMNVDSIQLAQNLWQDKAMRQAIIAMASQYQPHMQGMPTEPISPQIAKSGDQANTDHAMHIDAQAVKNNIDALQLPIGWGGGEDVCKSVNIMAVLGWLITACFVSLGAPFWFNALGKALSLRACGSKPPRSNAK